MLINSKCARAYAAFGDPLAEDPFCTYIPPGYARAQADDAARATRTPAEVAG